MAVALSDLDRRAWRVALAHFQPKRRRWASPLDMACHLDPTTVRTPALELINRELVALADGDEHAPRLMVFMPPQEGKSTLCSKWYPLWRLVDDPDRRVAIVSYSDEMARRWGADIKQLVEAFDGTDGTVDLGIRLREDSRAAGRWQVAGRLGGVYAVGVAGSLTGKPVDDLVWDDPLKDLEQAQSLVYRDRAWRFWQAVAVPRLGPGAKCLLIETRWHEDDPGGRMLTSEDADRWRVVSIPAISEGDSDPLGRPAGVPMQSARGNRDWNAIRRSVGEYVWASLYQQRPAPAEGGLFRRIWWRYWTPAPDGVDLAGRRHPLADSWRFITADLAASTRTAADWTVFACWARTLSGDLVLLDRIRARIDEGQHFQHVRGMVERWGVDTVFVEATHQTMTLVREATQNGIPVTPLRAEQDKFSRALPASAWVSSGRVWLPAGQSWTGEFVDECAGFPNGRWDDQVDVLGYAVRVAVTYSPPRKVHAPPRERDPLAGAFGGREVDFLNAAL